MQTSFEPGIAVLLTEHRDWLYHQRIGLLSHHAAVDSRQRLAAELLRNDPELKLAALFGPEHGFDGIAPAGQSTADSIHPDWSLPVYSLYGDHRKPTPAMLRGLDLLVVDLQDIGARPYTYVSTLRYFLEAATAAGLPVIVADRPTPLPDSCDGPLLDPALESFVGCVRTPMTYGMTPGETALWLRSDLGLNLDLRIASMRGYTRQPRPGLDWPPWVPPSPRMLSWESAQCFAATVFTEALPAVDNGSGTSLVFQVVGSAFPVGSCTEGADALTRLSLPGVVLQPVTFTPTLGAFQHREMRGARLTIADPVRFRPAQTAVAILACIQQVCGRDRLWNAKSARAGFFDQLFGDRAVREALIDGEPAAAIAQRWEGGLTRFRKSRADCLLYPNPPGDEPHSAARAEVAKHA